jgi:4-nitrophenyl phosphatase
MMTLPSGIKALILDMDGVLWRVDTPIGDLKTLFAALRSKGYAIVLATNNSTRTIPQYLQHLDGFGVDHLEPWQIVTSAEAVGEYLQAKFPDGGPVYVVGEDGLLEALRQRGFYLDQSAVVAVAAGMDRQINYQKLTTATRLIRNGAAFIGTNPDRTFPTPQGLIPGTGSILAAIQAATDIQPLVLGKPGPYLYEMALQRLSLQPAQALVVGDRLDTDIIGAQELGCPSALVLSGVSTAQEAQHWQPTPDWIGPDLAALIAVLP